MTSAPQDSYIHPVTTEELAQAAIAGLPDAATQRLIEDECQALARRRTAHEQSPPVAGEQDGRWQSNLTGITISGGGIRSATIGLGVLQALARRDLLERFDYLSTVSGGSYTGSSLSWWLSEASGAKPGFPKQQVGVGRTDFPYGTDQPAAWRGLPGTAPGPRLLRYLRVRGNYLTPGDGLNFTSGIAILLRAMLVNLAIWLPLITLLFAVLIAALPGAAPPAASADPSARSTWGLLWVLGAALLLAVGFLIVCLGYSLATGVFSWFGIAKQQVYRFRRAFERWAGVYLGLFAVLAVVGAIPLVEGMVRGEMPVSQSEVGLLGLVLGLIAAGRSFLRTTQASPVLRVLGRGSGGGTAILAAALVLFGILVIAHDRAGAVSAGANGWYLLVIAALIALAVAFLVNTNHTSLARFYRDRLMEAFMPNFAAALANDQRQAADQADRLKLSNCPHARRDAADPAAASDRAPFHIINATCVLVHDEDRRVRLRGGASFVLTPRYCGSNPTGWCPTPVFMRDGMTLPTAMAISGAAANPNTGFGGVGPTRSRPVALLMSLLNIRLGYWVPHPDTAKATVLPAPNHVLPGLLGAFGRLHRSGSGFQEISDGGHFENLGLYELVRRRVRLIVVIDGGQDPDGRFANLQLALRRIGEDFGAQIHFEQALPMEAMVGMPQQGPNPVYPLDAPLAERGFAVARIVFPPDLDSAGVPQQQADRAHCRLVYIKSALLESMPLAVRGYRAANPDFPYQSTADQFFDEDQFEAYRELGYDLGEAAAGQIESELARIP